jgi:hypothetical protein
VKANIQLLLISLFFLVQCTFQQAGVETSNGKIVTAQYTDGSVAVNARVNIITSDSWYRNVSKNQSVILDNTITNDKGEFLLKKDLPGRFSVEIDGNVQGIFIENTSKENLDIIKLANYGTITIDKSNGISDILLSQTSIRSKTDPVSGKLIFNKVPEGEYGLLVPDNRMPDLTRLLLGTATDVKPDTLVSLPLVTFSDTLKLSLFEKLDSRCALYPITGAGHYYHYSDSAEGGNSSSAFSYDDGVSSKCVRIDGIFYPGQNTFRYAGMATYLGSLTDTTKRFLNFSSMKAFIFKAKAINLPNTNQTMGVTFDLKGIRGWPSVGKDLSLTSDWKEYVLYTDSLTKERGLWSDIGKNTEGFHFNIGSSAPVTTDTVRFSFWIDDIRMVGVSIDEIMKK